MDSFHINSGWCCLIVSIMLTSFTSIMATSKEFLESCRSLDDPPSILIIQDQSLSDVFESHHFNHSTSHLWPIKFQACSVNVDFLCSASYPIEWVEIHDQETKVFSDTTDLIHKTIWADREVQNNNIQPKNSSYSIFNAKITRFNANLGLSYKSDTSLCVAANYSCRSINHPCKQTNLIAGLHKKEKIIEYELSYELIYEGTRNQDECAAIIVVSLSIAEEKIGWKCINNQTGKQEYSPRHRTCDSAMHCGSFFTSQRNQKCIKRLSTQEPCLGCVYMNISEGILPGFVWCENDHGKPITVLHHFFSVPQNKLSQLDSTLPKLYLKWDDADPSTMMYFYPIESELYIGQNITFFCSVSRYYFAYGHRFGFEYANGTTVYSEAIDGTHDLTFNTNIMNFTLLLDDISLQRAYCFAPVWNSTEWVNKSQSIVLKDGASPPSIRLVSNNGIHVIDKGDGESEITFTLHDRNQTILCISSGTPIPEIQWISLSDEEEALSNKEVMDDGPGMKSLVFGYVTYLNRGKYMCVAQNFLGTATAKISVKVRDEMTFVVQLGATFIFTLIIVFGVTLSICWSKVQHQRKRLRALTDEEIREFREGNLDAVQNSAFLDNESLLHALPYNDEFEIPKRDLFIDTSVVLGSGNFGQVFRGHVFGNFGENRYMEVAVKTVKPRFDVNYFKALLSEVKIMAYIGKHANVVSLVGACTENIRKREIFIAVEYCSRGSLEQFLKKSRVSFVNLISNDTIYINTNIRLMQNLVFHGSMDGGRRYENTHSEKSYWPLLEEDNENASNGTSISTVDLLKWSREIANGMEFLENKKIIHGDLATRNVLLKGNVAKISDFGLSKQLMEYSNYVRSSGDDFELPWKWMAFEVLEEGKFSPQSDAWSFGVTLWEIFSLGQTPYPGILWSSSFIVHLREGLRLHKPPYATSHLYNLMLDCWAMEPSARPTFTELKDVFEGLLLYSCNNEYFKTDTISCRSSSQCININNKSTNIPVHNPGYSIISQFEVAGEPTPEQTVSIMLDKGEGRVKFEKGAFSMVSEDVNGYLKPLILPCSDEEQQLA